jgi:hypothetical protein
MVVAVSADKDVDQATQVSLKLQKMGLCKELGGYIFNYGGHGAADTMRVTQEKIDSKLVSSLVRILQTRSRIRNWWF